MILTIYAFESSRITDVKWIKGIFKGQKVMIASLIESKNLYLDADILEVLHRNKDLVRAAKDIIKIYEIFYNNFLKRKIV